MPVGDYCRRNVGTIKGTATLAEAGTRMKEENTGCLVVLDLTDRPCGLVTDRDLALRALCGRLDARTGKLDSILVRPGEFAASNGYVIRTGGAEYRIRLNRIITKGADWIKARFEIEAKQA